MSAVQDEFSVKTLRQGMMANLKTQDLGSERDGIEREDAPWLAKSCKVARRPRTTRRLILRSQDSSQEREPNTSKEALAPEMSVLLSGR